MSLSHNARLQYAVARLTCKWPYFMVALAYLIVFGQNTQKDINHNQPLTDMTLCELCRHLTISKAYLLLVRKHFLWDISLESPDVYRPRSSAGP